MPKPSVLPHRVPPPPPSRSSYTKSVPAGQATARHDATNGTEVEESSPPLTSLQARMAALQLNQVGRSPSSTSTPPPIKLPPRAPPRLPQRSQSQKQVDFQPTPDRSPGSKNQIPSAVLVQLLARKPPPVPAALVPNPQETIVPQLPPRRVPPLPTTKTATPEPPAPPPVNRASRPNVISASPEPINGSGSAFIPGTSCFKCHDFSNVDNHAAMFPREHVSSLQTLAVDLTEPFTTETEKARAIFTWMHHNIAYDAQSFLSGNIKPATADSVLQSGQAVCDGYSTLYVTLAEYAGLQVYKVSGHGKGYGYKPLQPGEGVPPFQGNHAWNCVLMDGEWRLIDSTWGAGALHEASYVKRFEPSWFTSTSAEFGRRHYPEDPSYQLLSEEEGGPVSWEEYIAAAPGPELCTSFHALNLDPSLVQPYAASLRGGNHYQFTLFKSCEHLSTADEDNYCLIIYFGNTWEPLFQNAEGGWSGTIYVPPGAGAVTLGYVDTVNGQDAKGLAPRTYVNSVRGKKALTFQGLGKWNVE